METKLVTTVIVNLGFEAENLCKQDLIDLLVLTMPYKAADDAEEIEHSATGADYSFYGEYEVPIDEHLKSYVLGLLEHPLLQNANLEISLDFGAWSDFNKMEISYNFMRQNFDSVIAFVVASGTRFSVTLQPEKGPSIPHAEAGEAAAEGVAVLEETTVIYVDGKLATEDQIRWLNTRLEDAGFRPKYLPDFKEHGIEFVGDFVQRFYELDSMALGGRREQSQSKLIAMGLKRPATKRVHQVEGWVRPNG